MTGKLGQHAVSATQPVPKAEVVLLLNPERELLLNPERELLLNPERVLLLEPVPLLNDWQ